MFSYSTMARACRSRSDMGPRAIDVQPFIIFGLRIWSWYECMTTRPHGWAYRGTSMCLESQAKLRISYELRSNPYNLLCTGMTPLTSELEKKSLAAELARVAGGVVNPCRIRMTPLTLGLEKKPLSIEHDGVVSGVVNP